MLNPDSFAQVLDLTETTETGIRIPAHLMPMGRAIFAQHKGKLTADLATRWHEMVKGEFERQEEELRAGQTSQATEDSGGAATPAPAGGREDGEAGGRQGGTPPAKVAATTIEDQLQAVVEGTEKEIADLEAKYYAIEVELRELDVALKRAKRALDAYRNDTDSEG
jgi:hypothetical protein